MDLKDSLKVTVPSAELAWGSRLQPFYGNASTVVIVATTLALLLCVSGRPISELPEIFGLRLAAVILMLFYLGPLAETWASGSHYFAPAASLLFLTPLMAIRHWRVWRWKGLRLGCHLCEP